MTVVKNVLNRIHVQRLLLAAALLGVSLTANANFIARTTHGNFEVVRNGKVTELRPPGGAMGNGNAVASTGTVTQGMGATAGGATAASGVNLAGTVTVPVNVSNVPVAVKTNVTSDVLIPAALGALGCVSGGVVAAVVCGAAVVAAPLALNWIANAGGRINPTTKQLELADPANPAPWPSDGFKYQLTGGAPILIYNSPLAACAAYNAANQASLPTWGPWTVTGCTPGVSAGVKSTGEHNPNSNKTLTQAVYKMTESNNCPPPNFVDLAGRCVADGSGGWLPISMSDIAPYMKKVPVDPGIVNELTNAGQDLGNPPLQVTGPSTVPGPSTTSINITSPTTTTTTVTNTTNNYNYDGNKVTNTGQTQTSSSTTATKNPDGTTTTSTPTTSTTTTTPGDPAKPEEQKVQCDKYPNSLGCAELDTPDGEIPKDTKDVSFSAEDPFGGGRCPADVMASFRAIGGQSLKIVDWTTFCGQAVPLRGLVLALASIMAFFIIMPGGVRE